jgi:hypothetical protein
MQGPYDFQERPQDESARPDFLEWDFVLTRDDGKTISIEPNYTNTKLTSYSGVPITDNEV